MNRDDFRQEVHSYLNQMYDVYISYQDILKETFKEVHRICEKNGIRYYLAWGTLLGYVRDGDEVLPWDCDLDINVPYEDIPKLLDALDKDLSDDFYYESNFNVPDYPLFQLRVTKKGENSIASHVDIFYMLSAPSETHLQEKMQRQIRSLFFVREWKYRKIDISVKKNKVQFMLYSAFNKIMSITHSQKMMNKRFVSLTKRNKNSNFYVIFSMGAEVMPTSFFEPSKTVNLGYSVAHIPNKSEDFLTQRYGDYLSYASIEDRFREMYNGYMRIKRLSKSTCSENKDNR